MKHQNDKPTGAAPILALAAAAAAGISVLLSGTAEAAGAATKPSVCNRSCWNARSASLNSNMSALNRAVIHHTAASSHFNTTSQSTSASMVRGVQNYQMDVNGWSDIGYHYLVDKLGNIFEGRRNSDVKSEQRRGAHDAVNTNSFGFVMMGYHHPSPNQSFTTAGRNALWDLIAWRMPNGWSPYGSGSYGGKTVGRVAGHRNVGSTACPGDIVYATIGTNYNGGTARNAINSRINPTVTTVTVDNTHAGFSASANWGEATWSSDKFGSSYHWRETEFISDPATWTGNLPQSGSWRVDAWWTESPDRATAAAYHIHHSGGTAVENVNQTANGGQWNSLGTYTFGSGNRQVQLSCWTSSGDKVIADAVRWVKQ